jgi:hypothetical protein
MKLPFEFGSKFILRLLLPGVTLGAASLPLALASRGALGLKGIDDVTAFAATALLFGWLILLADMPIYMLFEGRRYWPRRLWDWGIRRESERLKRISERADDRERHDRVEYQIMRVDDFPLTNAGNFEALYPTRLGNLLTSYERYPDRKYGMDGVFFWYRIWLSIDKDLRDELDGAQAIADGALYLAFALVLSTALLVIYAVVSVTVPTLLPHLNLSAATLLIGALVSALLSWCVYRSSLHAQRQYGQLFKALFDQHRNKVDVSGIVNDLADAFGDPLLPTQPERVKNQAAWRFLRFHRYRPRKSGAKNLVVSGWVP